MTMRTKKAKCKTFRTEMGMKRKVSIRESLWSRMDGVNGGNDGMRKKLRSKSAR